MDKGIEIKEGLLEEVKEEKGSMNHIKASRGGFRFSFKPSEPMAAIAVGGFDGECEVFAVEVTFLRQKSKESRPFIGYEVTRSMINFLDKSLKAGIATSAQFPSKRLTRYPINRSPDP